MELKYNVLGINYFRKKFKDNKKYYDIYFNKNVIFKNCNFEKKLIIENCDFEGKLEIINCNGKIEIKHPKGLKNIKIYNDGKNIDKKLEIKINNIKFNKEGDYFFSGSSLKKITFKSCVNLSDYFKMTHLNDIELNFIDVNLGKTTFNGVKINKLYLENATLNDCIFNGVEFPKNYKLEGGKLSTKQLKDNYRQLKHVMDKNGNYTEANRFFEGEMSYHIFSWNGFKRLHDNILGFFQLIISQFGNNWFLPLLWIILLGFIYTYTIDGKYFYNYLSFDYYLNEKFINSFFTNINPFDKSLFTKEGITWQNFLHKIILVILYWHLLIALKRTTKR